MSAGFLYTLLILSGLFRPPAPLYPPPLLPPLTSDKLSVFLLKVALPLDAAPTTFVSALLTAPPIVVLSGVSDDPEDSD